jgi:hypothetical protein
MLPTEDIIPITYMGGTGGNFLCHFIVSAKRNVKTVIKFSEHGNAHQGNLKDISGPPVGPKVSDQYKINFILSQLDEINQKGIPGMPVVKKPYYTSSHITDLNLINSHFKKSIRIIYDNDDHAELSSVFYGKWFVDQRNQWEIDGEVNRLKQITIVPDQKKGFEVTYIKFSPLFCNRENMPNVLFISWKELFKGNIEELITKISTFTDINPDNFSRESLIHWRTKTQYCIDTFSETK